MIKAGDRVLITADRYAFSGDVADIIDVDDGGVTLSFLAFRHYSGPAMYSWEEIRKFKLKVLPAPIPDED